MKRERQDQNAANDPSEDPTSRRENTNENRTAVNEGVSPPPHGARGNPLAALAESAKNYARADNTRRAYDADWRHFSSWLRRQGFSQLTPDPQTVGLYLAACADGPGAAGARNIGGVHAGARNIGAGHSAGPTSVATLERRLSGICWHYRQLGDPLDARDRHISTVLAGIRRQHGRPPVQKEAIFADDLLAMLSVLDMDLRGLRDRAILAIGFAGGLRRSEITGLDCGREQTEDGTGWIEIFPADPGGEGGVLLTINGKTGWREVEIGRGSRPDTCPVALLETWMRLGRISHGPLFRPIARKNGGVAAERLTDKHVARLMQKTALKAGIRGS